MAIATVGLAALTAAPGGAQPGDGSGSALASIDEVARALAEAMTPRWEGPRVPWPMPSPRPEGAVAAAGSPGSPVLAHAATSIPTETLQAAQRELEIAYAGLDALGLMVPAPDGGRGGTDGVDVYLLDDLSGIAAYADAPVAVAPLDAVTSFATVGRVAPGALASCVTAAYAEAVLLARDPGEEPALRRAMAGYLAHLLTGRYGCDDDVAIAQASPSRSLLHGGGGALFFTLLARRHDGGRGLFPAAVFDLSRQRTADGGALRGRPDVRGVLERALAQTGPGLRATVEDFAVERYLLGLRGEVPAVAAPAAIALAALPVHVGPGDEVEVFGSVYARIDLRGAAEGTRLHAWLEGERGVDWALAAVAIGSDARALQRVSAPSGQGVHRVHVTVELLREVSELVLVGTNLGVTGARGAEPARRALLTVDLARDRPGAR